MSKSLITADLHLGVPGRLADSIWAMTAMRDYARDNSIGTILVLGDGFHDQDSIGVDVLCAAYSFYKEAKSAYNQEWMIFPGNHDMFLKHGWAINSLLPLAEVLTVIGSVKIIMLDGLRFWVLPFIHLENAYMRVLHEIEARYEPGDILLTHIGVTGAVRNTCFKLKEWSLVSFTDSPFDLVYTGHFHSHQQVGQKVWYPGGPIPFRFDEGDVPHGFLVFDHETRTHEFVDIWKAGAHLPGRPPPRYCTIADSDLSNLTVEDVANNQIRIALTHVYTTNERQQISQQLAGLGAKSVRWLDLSPAAATPQLAVTDNQEQGDQFEAWLALDQGNLDGLKPDLLRALNGTITTEGDGRYNFEEDS